MSQSSTQLPDSILINEKTILVDNIELPHSELSFWVENPRIHSILRRESDNEPTQQEIEDQLLKMDHVKELIQDIRRNGGLTDPVIVRKGSLEVLEGNSRLAAYRHLARLYPTKWHKIRVRLLPEDINESDVLALLGLYHLKGKKAWDPFEKAGFLYRRHKENDVEVGELAKEVGETKNKVAHMVEVFEFMLKHDQVEKHKWSYYDEYLKNRTVKKHRDKGFDDLIVKKIESGEIERAVDIREKLPVILKAPKQCKKFIDGTINYEEAFEIASDSGNNDNIFKRINKFRTWLSNEDTERNLTRTPREARKKIEYELKKLGLQVEKMLREASKGHTSR